MKNPISVLLLIALLVVNGFGTWSAANGSFGPSDPMIFLYLVLVWLGLILVDVILTANSQPPRSWGLCAFRIVVCCVGVLVNLSTISQIMYVS